MLNIYKVNCMVQRCIETCDLHERKQTNKEIMG